MGDGGGDLCIVDFGSFYVDIVCFVVDILVGVICWFIVIVGIIGNVGVDNYCGGWGIVDCFVGDCGVVVWVEMAVYVRLFVVAVCYFLCGFCY